MSERDHLVPHGETERQIPQEALDREHEQRDFGVGWLFGSLAALGFLVVGASVAMWLLFGVFEARQQARDPEPSPLMATPEQPPQPRLERAPGEVLARLRANEEILLNEYAWVDREAGLARIPVDRAIDILAERGLPWRGAPAEPQDTTGSMQRAPGSEQ